MTLSTFLTVFLAYSQVLVMSNTKEIQDLLSLANTAKIIAAAETPEHNISLARKLISTAKQLIDEVVGVDLPPPPPAHYAPAPEQKELGIDYYIPNQAIKGKELTNVLKKAAKAVGVPESWASDPFLHKLIEQESGAKPDAKNGSSSAFGLFQMVSRTWEALVPLIKKVMPTISEEEMHHGSKNPLVQAIAGLKYIQTVYKTPERAQKFREATLNGDASLAPEDLQAKAAKWISKKYKGY